MAYKNTRENLEMKKRKNIDVIKYGELHMYYPIKFNTKLYGISSTPLLILIVTGLVALLLYGKVTNQAKSWFQLGPITIQPSEFAKVVIIAFIARYYELNGKSLSSPLVVLFL